MEPESDDRSLEFVIDKNQSIFVQNAEGRIAYLFNVRVKLNDVFEGSPKHKQWICVSGTENEINKAKEYILALTSPEETIHMKNIRGHPLFTEEKQDEIERCTCAALAKYGDDDLVIFGTELSVMLAQSMIDDLFSKTTADILDNEEYRKNSRSILPDSKVDMYTYHDPYVKDNDRAELRGNASLNKNNSSLTSLIPQSSSALTGVAAAHYTDGVLALGSPSNSPINGITVTEKPLFPHQIINNSLYASASAIFPRAQMFVSTVPQYNKCAFSQTNVAMHTVNHTGDGTVSKVSSHLPANLQNSGQVGFGEIPVEDCSLNSRIGLPYLSPQVKGQEAYLRDLGLSLHYTNEDIEKGLACYNMDDVVIPSEFLETLKRIKAQRHGGGHQNVSTDYRENIHMPHTSTSLAVSSTVTKSKAASSEPSMDDFDDSVICVGSVNGDKTIIVSSDDEADEPDKIVSVPPNHLLPTCFPVRPLSESQPANRKDPTVSKERAVTMNGNSFTMGEGSAVSQKQTVHRILRYIIIDGSNVAMAHGDNKVFSVEGLRICINYFVERGHDRITAFVPEWRRYSGNTPKLARDLLEKLGNDGYIKFTPARRINGKTIASYDDRFILNLAEKEDGIVVSNDQFRDLCQERDSYKNIVANRLLQFMFVGDHFMPPDDPLGRHGPHLDDFLRYPHQPHMKNIQPLLMEERLMVNLGQSTHRQPIRNNFEQERGQPIRSRKVTVELFQKLTQMFPEPNQEPKIRTVLNNHKQETDLNRLTNYCINIM